MYSRVGSRLGAVGGAGGAEVVAERPRRGSGARAGQVRTRSARARPARQRRARRAARRARRRARAPHGRAQPPHARARRHQPRRPQRALRVEPHLVRRARHVRAVAPPARLVQRSVDRNRSCTLSILSSVVRSHSRRPEFQIMSREILYGLSVSRYA